MSERRAPERLVSDGHLQFFNDHRHPRVARAGNCAGACCASASASASATGRGRLSRMRSCSG
eukprot:COSAG03_NODE_25144_length_267_cov_1.148810_1_plen_61_part_01